MVSSVPREVQDEEENPFSSNRQLLSETMGRQAVPGLGYLHVLV